MGYLFFILTLGLLVFSPLKAELTQIQQLILKTIKPETETSLTEILDHLNRRGYLFSKEAVKKACIDLISKGNLIKNGHGIGTTYTLSKDPFMEKNHLEKALAKLTPENELEQKIITSEEWRIGACWGQPRRGHPEGAVIHHINEVLDNVDRLYGSSPLRKNLRLIALIHDTFKYKVDNHQPKTGENHHAMIARRFAEQFIQDPAVLDVIQWHDEAYNAWVEGSKEGDWENSHQRAAELEELLGSNLELYLAFYECDVATGDKNQEPFEWFKDFIKN